jgi:hypothetical protein
MSTSGYTQPKNTPEHLGSKPRTKKEVCYGQTFFILEAM